MPLPAPLVVTIKTDIFERKILIKIWNSKTSTVLERKKKLKQKNGKE